MTQSDIAKAAGVTRKTVSLYFNNSSKVAVKTAAKIRAVCEKYGYKPNYAARTIRGATFRRVACIQLRKITADGREGIYPHQLQYINGMTNVLSMEKYSLELSPIIINENHDRQHISYPMLFSESCVDGIIGLPYGTIPEAVAKELSSINLPSVWLNTTNPPTGGDSIVSDEEGGCLFLTNFLINRGRKRIAWLGNQPSVPPHYSDQTRRAGVNRALTQANLPDDMAIYIKPHEAPSEAISRLFKQYPDVDAIISNTTAQFTSNTYLSEIKKRGASFEMAYISSEWLAKDFLTKGACLIIPETKLGECAAKQLIAKLNNHQVPNHTQFVKPTLQFNGHLIKY